MVNGHLLIRGAVDLPLLASRLASGSALRLCGVTSDRDGATHVPVNTDDPRVARTDIVSGTVEALVDRDGCELLEALVGGECLFERLPPSPVARPPRLVELDSAELKRILRLTQVAIITTTEVELKTLAALMEPPPVTNGIYRGSISTNFGWITMRVGMLGRYLVAHVACGEMGSQGCGASASVTARTISAIEPNLVLMVGVAFGVCQKKQRLGDVLIAESIVQYELGKIRDDGMEHRPKHLRAGPRAVNQFREYADGWSLARGASSVGIHRGPVLSGEKVINSRSVRDALLERFPEAIGGEMEGIGMYATVSGSNSEALLVKGICDWADGSKADRPQAFAAYASVCLVRHVLSKHAVLEPLACAEANLAAFDDGLGSWRRVETDESAGHEPRVRRRSTHAFSRSAAPNHCDPSRIVDR